MAHSQSRRKRTDRNVHPTKFMVRHPRPELALSRNRSNPLGHSLLAAVYPWHSAAVEGGVGGVPERQAEQGALFEDGDLFGSAGQRGGGHGGQRPATRAV